MAKQRKAQVTDQADQSQQADGNGTDQQQKKSRKASDQSNRPVYMLFGVNKHTTARELIAIFVSQGRAHKFLQELPNYVRGNYSSLECYRCKRVPVPPMGSYTF